MSLEQLLQEVTFKLASEIADPKIVCRIVDHRIKKDRHGRNMLILQLQCHGHGRVVVALSPMFAREFGERMKKLGIEKISDMYDYCFEWERIQLPRVRQDYNDPYPRYLPTKIVDCPEDIAQV